MRPLVGETRSVSGLLLDGLLEDEADVPPSSPAGCMGLDFEQFDVLALVLLALATMILRSGVLLEAGPFPVGDLDSSPWRGA